MNKCKNRSHIQLWSPLLLQLEQARSVNSRWGSPLCDWSSVSQPPKPCRSRWPRGCWERSDRWGATLYQQLVQWQEGNLLWWHRWQWQVTPKAPPSWRSGCSHMAWCPLTNTKFIWMSHVEVIQWQEWECKSQASQVMVISNDTSQLYIKKKFM